MGLGFSPKQTKDIRTRAQVTVSRKNMNYLNTRVLPVLWFGEWFVKFAHICLFMFKQCRRGKSQRHTLTNLRVTSLFKFSCSDPTVFLLPAISFGIHSHNSCHPQKTLRAATKKNLSLAISYEKNKGKKTCELSTLHKNLWGFLQRGSYPIQVPR